MQGMKEVSCATHLLLLLLLLGLGLLLLGAVVGGLLLLLLLRGVVRIALCSMHACVSSLASQ
jgi:hypothetical protein